MHLWAPGALFSYNPLDHHQHTKDDPAKCKGSPAAHTGELLPWRNKPGPLPALSRPLPLVFAERDWTHIFLDSCLTPELVPCSHSSMEMRPGLRTTLCLQGTQLPPQALAQGWYLLGHRRTSHTKAVNNIKCPCSCSHESRSSLGGAPLLVLPATSVVPTKSPTVQQLSTPKLESGLCI